MCLLCRTELPTAEESKTKMHTTSPGVTMETFVASKIAGGGGGYQHDASRHSDCVHARCQTAAVLYRQTQHVEIS